MPSPSAPSAAPRGGPARRRPASRRRLAGALLALAALAAAAPAPAEVHPFYEHRLSAGVIALSRGDAATAQRELRIAAFGLLEEPARLVVALAHLALAGKAAGDTQGLDETLQRLLAIERRFEVWAGAELPPATLVAIEETLAERVPEAALAAVPSFAAVARRRAAERVAALPLAERRRELLARAAAEPDAALWHVMLGELELAAGDTARAVALAQRALASQPEGGELVAARCLRGTALARSDSCAAAVADLEACPATRREAEPARQLLQCHAQLGQWRQAKALADALPTTVKSRRDVSRLVRQVDREVARLPAAAAPGGAPTATAAAPGGAPAEPPAAAVTPTGAATDGAPVSGAPASGAPAGGAQAGGTPASGTPASGVPASGAPGSGTPASGTPVAGAGTAAGTAASPQPAAPALPAADRARLERARELMAQARRASELGEALALATAVADAHPRSVEAQHLTAEIAYRGSRWPQAVTYFRRGGEPEQPHLLFYLAVALWESGERQEAARVLEAALPRLQRGDFVDRYSERILGRTP